MAKTSATQLKAFAFRMDMNLDELYDYLQDRMGVKWFQGSKDWSGDYISVRIEDTGSIIRIFNEGEKYAFDMLNKTGCPEEEYSKELEAFMDILKEKGAKDFAPTEDYY